MSEHPGADPMSQAEWRAPVVALPVSPAREPGADRLRSLLDAVRAAAADPEPVAEIDAEIDAFDDDDEFAAQDLAMAGESADLRDRAAAVLAGGSIDRAAVGALLRAFRSYEPFLGARDRELNDAAARCLVIAVAATDHRCPAA